MYSVETLLKNPVFMMFHQICQIPHGSNNEYELGRWIVKWAIMKGFEATQDDMGNVLIRCKASKECSNAPSIMLQAHLDMVCVKAPCYVHDFTKDPIRWIVDGDYLSTGHVTTLGADDGIGVALALALLDDNFIHPALEILFTVGEEDDFRGVSFFDSTQITSKLLINLDHSNEHEVLCGSCGGMQVTFSLPVCRIPVPSDWSAFQLSIAGLIGGHSGKDVNKGHGNANVLLARMIDAISLKSKCAISDMTGGNFRLSIPRNAEAIICIPDSSIKSVKDVLDNCYSMFCNEFPIASKSLKYSFEETTTPSSCVNIDSIIYAMMLIPDGIYAMSEALPDQVVASDNLGEVYLRDSHLELILEIRSEQNSVRDYLFERMRLLATLLGGECKSSNSYPSWFYKPDSKLVSICKEAHNRLYGSMPTCSMVHAGLEVGYFYEKMGTIEAVSIGPNIWNLHTIDEQVSISSVQTFYRYLKEILSIIGQSSN